MAELGKVLDDEDIIFNEAVTNTPAVLMQIPRRLPNTAFNTNGAGLGWSGGMALGAKLAAPERLMVQIAGDGSFYFAIRPRSFAVRSNTSCRFCRSCSTIPAGRRSSNRRCASSRTARPSRQ
jgi:acetolactate synthase-1/2/3 large subunit